MTLTTTANRKTMTTISRPDVTLSAKAMMEIVAERVAMGMWERERK